MSRLIDVYAKTEGEAFSCAVLKWSLTHSFYNDGTQDTNRKRIYERNEERLH